MNDLEFNDVTIRDLNNIVLLIGENGSGKTRFLRKIHDTLIQDRTRPGFWFNYSIYDSKKEQVNYTTKTPGSDDIFFSTPFKVMVSHKEAVTFIEMPTVIQENLEFNYQRNVPTIEQEISNSRGRFNVPTLNQLIGSASIKLLQRRSEEIERGELKTKEIKEKYPELISKINDALSRIIPYLALIEPEPSDNKVKCQVRGEIINPANLSSGEFIVLILALEILSRSIEKGVVLIDEIDAHLHPDLQSKLIPFVRTLLGEGNEDIQIWISTHSPAVLDPASLAGIDHSVIHSSISTNKKISLEEVSEHTVAYPQSFFRLLGASPYYGRKKTLYVEGDTEKQLLNSLFLRKTELKGVWNVELLGSCNKVIDTLRMVQHLKNGPFLAAIPELTLIHGLVDNDDGRTRKNASDSLTDESKNQLFIWPFYHTENLILQDPWFSHFVNSIRGMSALGKEEVSQALERAKTKYIRNQKSKSEDDQGRRISDKTIKGLLAIPPEKDFKLALPGKELINMWVNELGIQKKGGIGIKKFIREYLAIDNLEIPVQLEAFTIWISESGQHFN